MPDAAPNSNGGRHAFGTFAGVFTPSILTILGVIMYMRAGFVVGEAGIGSALLILGLCTSITFLTGLSISAIATNTPMRGGGAYFMISRVLGPEFGGAIGVALFMAQALSVPFYILGFVEALTRTWPALEPRFMQLTFGSAAVVFVVAVVGAAWAIRVQFLILTVLGLSILAFLGGAALNFQPATFAENWRPGPNYDFWRLFAIYFPAVTGIMAGVNMSGDLREPERAIPRGTLAAIVVGSAVYGLQMFLCGGAQSRGQLVERPYHTLVDQALGGMGFLVVAGVFAATISSAIGSFLGAPRVLQALARDRVYRLLKPFGFGSRGGDEPYPALLMTFAITLLVLWYAGSGKGGAALNAVAATVTMFFLFTYGMTNMAAFVESFGLNPSFRPRFRWFHWCTALAGTIGCVATALLISFPAALAASGVVAALYLYARSQVLETAFGDARRGFFYARARSNLLKLDRLKPHPKNWRPTVLALTGNPHYRATLATVADWLECGRGIVTLVNILPGRIEEMAAERLAEVRRLQEFVKSTGVAAFPEVLVAPDFDEGLTALLQAHSIGPLKSNLVMFGWSGDSARAAKFSRHLRIARSLGMSLIVVAGVRLPPAGRATRIDLWWRGRENGSLMLILAHLLTRNWAWARARIRILRVVSAEADRQPAAEELERIVQTGRIPAEIEVIVSQNAFPVILRNNSTDAGLVLLGFRMPGDPSALVFSEEYRQLFGGLPVTLLTCSTGEADLLA